jgi:hypothetical protein
MNTEPLAYEHFNNITLLYLIRSSYTFAVSIFFIFFIILQAVDPLDEWSARRKAST